MKKSIYGLIVVLLLLCPATYAKAQVSIGIGLPNLSIGINLPIYPDLVPVPGYPVYYAPQMDANYFFYDGMYWVYQDDNWYASSWYNGPWGIVEPYAVPLFILRIPVRYYQQPPVYFRGWQSNAPPRWGQHWGRDWEHRRSGWDRWNRSSSPGRAPLPVYQRQYTGDRYPRAEQQHELRSQSYRYQPRDKVIRQHFKEQGREKAPAPAQRGKQESAPTRNQAQPDMHRSAPPQQSAPAAQHQQPQRGENAQRPAPVQPQHQQPAAQQPAAQRQQPAAQHQQPAAQHQQPAPQRQQQPAAQEQERRGGQQPQDSDRGRGQGQNKDEERGRGRN